MTVTNPLSILIRERNGRSANYIAHQWGFGDDNGSIKTDDEDEEWEEEEELDWSELEKHYWEDDIWNDGEAALPTMEIAAAAQQHAKSLLQEQTHNLLGDNFEWRHWRAGWASAVKAFQKKAMKINANPSLTSCGPPHVYFNDMDRAVCRSLIYSNSSEWLTLPGPAGWWPGGYDFKGHGFEGNENETTIGARETALRLLAMDSKPCGFESMVWSTKELMVLGFDFGQFF